jgi:rhamnosyltransferase
MLQLVHDELLAFTAQMTPVNEVARVHAVVVAFLPEVQPFSDLLEALSIQVAAIHVIDNTPASDLRVEILLSESALPNIQLTRLGDNYGIAKALNVGIEAALQAGATHVLLSDQDSLPQAEMVAGLLRADRELAVHGACVGAVGPTYTDAHTGITFPFQSQVSGKLFYGHVLTSAAQPLVEALSLITSGTLLTAEAWRSVGPMREDFFIDYVDIDWCYRARAAGFRLYGTAYAAMDHRMGDAHLRVWYFGWRRESAYSPLRVYYRMRNFVALCKRGYIPARWKIRNGWYTFGVAYSQVIFGSSHLHTLSMALRGLWDGLRGRMGRYPDSQRTRGNP